MVKRQGKWGFEPEKSQVIFLDRNDQSVKQKLHRKIPSLASCIFCGGCSATCTAGENGMNFRVLHLLICRGETQNLKELVAPCLLCGKCTLVCPRNVDTRSAIYNLKMVLYEH